MLIAPLLPLLAWLAVPAASTPVPDPFAIYRPDGHAPDAAAIERVQGSFHRFAVPLEHTPSSIKRELARRSGEAWDSDWLLQEAAKVNSRYNYNPLDKRQNGAVTLQNNGKDASYAGQVSVGTPAQNFPIILDTGSSDFWIESNKCPDCPGTRFDESKSSTYKGSTTKFAIRYGSGDASGVLAQDTVGMGGYNQPGQTFAVVDQMKEGLITDAVTGIMGLAFASLSYSKSTPWWLAVSNSWQDKLFAFHLKRFRNSPTASSVEADGGVVNFGYLDNSLYSGDITYVPLAANPQYWHITLGGLSVQGTDIPLGGADQVAVDTGTTLIGGPESAVTALYAAIPGARRMTGGLANYFEYPCSTSIDLKLTFGGHAISIGNADFDIGHSNANGAGMCTGGIFVQVLSASSPVNWILGATALKNTYTVFRSEPAAVGFANLAGADANASSQGQGSSSVAPPDQIPDAPPVEPLGSVDQPTSDTPSPSASASASASSSAAPSSSSGSASGSSSAARSAPASSASAGSGAPTQATVWVTAPDSTETADTSAAQQQPASAASRAAVFSPLLLLAAVPLFL